MPEDFNSVMFVLLAINNILTCRDQRLKGGHGLRVFFSFMIACSIGALANVGIATYLFENPTQWVLAALAGVLVVAVWNFAVTQIYTWGKVGKGRGALVRGVLSFP